MDKEYANYLEGSKWKQKRAECFKLRGYRCEVCGSQKQVVVHHLTYARIFNEDQDDLMPLCRFHHEEIERCVKRGDIGRSGDVFYLRISTKELLLRAHKSGASNSLSRPIVTVKTSSRPSSEQLQTDLLKEGWFVEALKLPRNQFKAEIRKRIKDKVLSRRKGANCFTIWYKKFPNSNHPSLIKTRIKHREDMLFNRKFRKIIRGRSGSGRESLANLIFELSDLLQKSDCDLDFHI